ncbi:MAG TPA: hypothetical protein VD886_03795, partial [Herpetosiphonaceae bacterium]|nr:hypothetical protein [Herpetosiphonaceae bacterium]
QPGAGVAGLGARFTLRPASADGTPNNQTYTIPGFIGDLEAGLDGPSVAKDCGSIDPDGDGGNDPIALSGDGCLRLSMGLNSTYLGDLGFVATDITDFDTWHVYVPDDLIDNIGSALLDWNLILQALPPLLDELQNTLEGGAADTKLPLIGDALDAGADIVGLINDNIVTPLADLAAQLNAAVDQDEDGDTDALDIAQLSQTEAFNLLEPSGLIQDAPWAQNGTVDAADIRIIAKCGDATTDCVDGDPLFSIYDLRITFVIGQGISAGASPVEGCDASCMPVTGVPFDIGLDGLPLSAEGSIEASAGWRLLVDFGLSRNEGPYIVVGGDGHDEPELSIGARAGLGNNAAACVGDSLSTAPLPNGDPAPLGNFSATRCMAGRLGFLSMNLRDGPDDDRTEVKLLSFLDVSADNDRLSFAAFSGLDLDYGLQADANVNLRFRTGIGDGEEAGFPSILGQFRLEWEWAAGSNPSAAEPTKIEFNHVHLDLGKFLSDYLGPIVKEVQRITKPLQPVIDTIRAPIPVLSDLSRLVGGGDITMIEVLEAVAGNDLTLIKRIIDLIDFINKLPTSGNVLIPLSDLTNAFKVSPSVAKGGPLAPTQAGSLISSSNPRSNLLNDVQQNSNWPSASGRPGGDGARVAATSFTPGGLSFPFLNNASEIFGVLMGKDATLIRYDAGTLRAGASINYTFGPIMVGPVPISIGLGGSIEVQGRFAIGYDTSGLRKVLSGGSGVHLFDGIFIDDLDSNGVDVPEISLIGTVSASAGVDL